MFLITCRNNFSVFSIFFDKFCFNTMKFTSIQTSKKSTLYIRQFLCGLLNFFLAIYMPNKHVCRKKNSLRYQYHLESSEQNKRTRYVPQLSFGSKKRVHIEELAKNDISLRIQIFCFK